jgi:hypothetical protein
MLNQVPELSKLRYKLCPGTMKEETFWRAYFLLIHNKIGVVLEDNTEPVIENETSNNTTSSPSKLPPPSPSTPRVQKQPSIQQSPEDIENYFDQLLNNSIASTAESPMDQGIEPDSDSYFSPPQKLDELGHVGEEKENKQDGIAQKLDFST